MRIRFSRSGARGALAVLPLAAVVGVLAWTSTGGASIATVAIAATPTNKAPTSPTATPTACPLPGSPLCPTPTAKPTATPTAKPSATPARTPTPRPTASSGGGGSGGGGGTGTTQPPPATTYVPPPAVAPADPGSLVGQGSGPPAPPPVPGSRVDMLADPQKVGPGESTMLTVTVSGSRGVDRYAVPNVDVDVVLSEKPDEQASLAATHLKTDVTGSATTRLTLSHTKGRHVVTASSGGVSSHLVFDTLAGSTASTGRARHSAGVITTAVPPVVDPAYLFMAAGVFLVGGFVLPYRRHALRLVRRGGRPAAAEQPVVDAPPEIAVPAATAAGDLEVSSGRKPRAVRRSAAPGG